MEASPTDTTVARHEYDESADLYFEWQQHQILMQKLHYFTTFNELAKRGVKGKTFVEVGCGHCPIGRRLADQGAAKIYGIDISEGMLAHAREDLTERGLIDKFELICSDITDEANFSLPEKVDCVVMCYVVVTFINSQEGLNKVLR